MRKITAIRRMWAGGNWSLVALSRLHGVPIAEVRRIVEHRPKRAHRARRAQAPPAKRPEWSPSQGPEWHDDDDLAGDDLAGDVPAIAAVMGQADPSLPMPPARPAPPAVATPCEGWQHINAAETHPHKLDDAAVRRLFLLKASGLSRRELADVLGVSVATIGRVIKAGPPPAAPDDGEPPAAPPAESGPEPHSWREEGGAPGPEWRDD